MFDISGYYQASSALDAVSALSADPSAVVVAGGTDVLIQVREGRLAGRRLVSVHGISGLRGIRDEGDDLVIGSGCTFSEIAASGLLASRAGVLCGAADQVGSPQIRNVATIGGNVCNGVTSADSACSLMVLEAELELLGTGGSRMVPIREWYAGPGKTVRCAGEILTAVRLPKKSHENFFAHYIKYGKREAMEISTLGCAVGVRLSDDKKIVEELRVAFGVAAPTPVRCPKTEAMAAGRAAGAELASEIGRAVLEEINPRDSWRASREFRMQIAKEISRRAFIQAVRFAGGDADA